MRTRSPHLATLVGLVLALGACGGGSDTPDIDAGPPDAAPPGGTLSVSWTLTDGQAALTCDAVKAAQVVLTGTPVGGGPGFTDLFTCASGQGMGMPHPPGSYTVKVELKNASGQVMSTATQNAVAIASSQNTQMSPVAFTVSKTGGLKFKIDVPATSGTNCDDEQGNPAGAGIGNFKLEVLSGTGPSPTCVPATFMVVAGGMGEPAQSISAACPGGGTGTCIEIDQEVTVTGLPAGDYTIKVTGLENGGADTCYNGTATASVSGGDVIKNAGTVNVVLVDPPGNCTGP